MYLERSHETTIHAAAAATYATTMRLARLCLSVNAATPT